MEYDQKGLTILGVMLLCTQHLATKGQVAHSCNIEKGFVLCYTGVVIISHISND